MSKVAKDFADKAFKSLVGPTDSAVDRKVREKLVTARVGMLLRASFFGNLATRLKLVNADDWCETAATDGRHFYYNTRFIEMLRPKEIEFLFGHEVLHCVYDHFSRRQDRDPQLWNIANDYCVNADLIKHKVGEKITSVPCLYDPQYADKSSEEVYDILFMSANIISIDCLADQLLDDHLENEGGDGDSDNNKEGNNRPTLSKEERDQIRDEIKEALLNAASTVEASSLPLGVKRIIGNITEPKMNWRELLHMQLKSTIKSDYTWMRTSRKGWHMDAVMPGMKNNERIDIAVAIDMSGSISDKQGKDFLGEIKGIMDSFESFNIHLFSFDTKVYNPQVFDSDNLDSIEEYNLNGGGGTDFTAIFDYLKNEGIEPERLVVFTDMYPCGSWGDPNYCDTLWIAHGPTAIVAPFGMTAYYADS